MAQCGTAYKYKKLGCRCDECREAVRVANAAWKVANKERVAATHKARYYENTKHRPRAYTGASPAKLLQAKRFLEDGTSYAEAARSVGIGEDTLARHFPGHGWTPQMSQQFAKMNSDFNN